MDQATLISNGKAIADSVAAKAAENEKQLDVSKDTIQAYRDAGFFKILRPKAFGGYELGPEDLFQAVLASSTGCGSSAWVLSLVAYHPWFAALLPAEGQEEVFADGDFLAPVVFAPLGKAVPVDDGFRISGRWGFCTGCTHANWDGLVAVRTDTEEPILFFCRADESRIVETWDAMGLGGTGSHDLIVDDVFVPARRTVSFPGIMEGDTPGGALHDNPLYRAPSQSVISMMGTTPGFAIAKGMLNEYLERAKSRTMMYGGVGKQQNQVGTQMRLAKAHAIYDAMEVFRRHGFTDLMRRAADGSLRSLTVRSRYRMWGALMMDNLYKMVVDLMQSSGASALRNDDPLQRAYRNMTAISTHYAFAIDGVSEQYGRMLLGLDPDGLI